MARAGLEHHDRTRLKKELEFAEHEWEMLCKHVSAINKVSTVQWMYFCFVPGVLSRKVNE